jgi:hypothetical protein
MTKYNPEVLIYIRQVKEFLQKNKDANDYLVGETNVEEFLEKVLDVSQKNFEKNGETMLTKEQFEEVRKSNIKINPTTSQNGIFMEVPKFGLICLN